MMNNPTDKKRLAAAVGALGEAFRQRITPATIMAYEMGLGDLPAAAIESAVRAAICQCKFMPTPAELRDLAGYGSISLQDRALRAWSAVESALKNHGYYHSVDFDDPVVNAAVRSLGGWVHLSELPRAERVAYFRRDFLRAYESLCRAGVSGELCSPLPGWFEQQNRGTKHQNHPAAIASTKPVRVLTGLPAHGEGVVRLPAPRPEIPAILKEIAADIGGLGDV